MLKNERYTREIQRLREENAELKELYETYKERCKQMSVLLNEYEKEKNVLNTQALFVERLQNELTQLKENRDEMQNS